jgi:hypothetical protein
MRSVFEVSLGLATFDGAWFGLRFKRETTDADADRNTEAGVAKIASCEGPLAASKGPRLSPARRTKHCYRDAG